MMHIITEKDILGEGRGGEGRDVTRAKLGNLDRACDRESREDHGKRKGRDHTGTHRDE